MWLANRRQSSSLLRCIPATAVCVCSGPSQDWTRPTNGADNQSPMKQDNRDHWTLFSANLQHLFQVVPPPTTLYFSKSSCFYLKLKWQFTGQKQLRFLGSSKNLSEHLSEEVNWLFCRRLSALSLPPPPLLTGAPTQSTQGNVVNFCYDRLRDNPTIAKHFVYLSHSHKSSRILKAEKEKAKIFWTGLVGV